MTSCTGRSVDSHFLEIDRLRAERDILLTSLKDCALIAEHETRRARAEQASADDLRVQLYEVTGVLKALVLDWPNELPKEWVEAARKAIAKAEHAWGGP